MSEHQRASASVSANVSAARAPRRFGPYQLGECLGKGGMAAVYKAVRRNANGFEKQVVVKMILPRLAKDPKLVRLFREEARLSAQLQHANVVRVNDFGVVDGTPFLELEYLSGCDLQRLWDALQKRGERLPVAIALAIIAEVARGLAYAHAFVDTAGEHRPIVHRDVSPANIMICSDGAVKLLDFGLARLTRGETLRIDSFHGKLAYMSPEQLDRQQLDRRADVFALGVLLHELLTGRKLFAGANDAETVQRVQRGGVELPSKHNRDVPPALDVVALRALQHDPDRRYASAVEMLAAIEALGSLVASRDRMLKHLGAVMADVFARPCDSCGKPVAHGAECTACKTQLDPGLPSVIVEAEEAQEAAAATELGTTTARVHARGATRPATAWLERRWRLMALTVSIAWRRLEAWGAQLLVSRAESSVARARIALAAAERRAA